MNRRNFLSVLGPVGALLSLVKGVSLTVPLSWLKGEPKVEPQLTVELGGVQSEWNVGDLFESERWFQRGYVIVEDAGTFGNLTNGYCFKLAVRETAELCWSEPPISFPYLEGRFLCDPPRNHQGENVETDTFEIASPSLTCLLRTFRDGTFKSNGPYRLSDELAERLYAVRAHEAMDKAWADPRFQVF